MESVAKKEHIAPYGRNVLSQAAKKDRIEAKGKECLFM
jgi:hypothetical protein